MNNYTSPALISPPAFASPDLTKIAPAVEIIYYLLAAAFLVGGALFAGVLKYKQYRQQRVRPEEPFNLQELGGH